MRQVIRGGRVIDPSQGLDAVTDIWIEDGRIVGIGPAKDDTAAVVDATGMLVMPGLVDMHVHLREPGFSHKETIRSGSRAAVNGGVTTVACMPNTQPAIHNREVVEWIRNKSKEESACRIEIVGAITRDIAGKELAEIDDMLSSGIIALSDDGKTTMDGALMEEAMRKIEPFKIPLISHAEEHTLSAGGAMHRGERSELLNIPGIPSAAEWKIIERDIRLAEKTGCRLHIAHISTREGIDLVREAKKAGLLVTCEAGPHHFILTDEIVEASRTETKVNPPLRPEVDRKALLEAILDGTVDAIATDHAPHDLDSKQVPYEKAAFGISGVETSLALSYSELVLRQGLSVSRLVELMAWKPAEILNLDRGTLKVGALADLIIFDPNAQWTIRAEEFISKGKNTPFDGRLVTGTVRDVFIEGNIKKREGKLTC